MPIYPGDLGFTHLLIEYSTHSQHKRPSCNRLYTILYYSDEFGGCGAILIYEPCLSLSILPLDRIDITPQNVIIFTHDFTPTQGICHMKRAEKKQGRRVLYRVALNDDLTQADVAHQLELSVQTVQQYLNAEQEGTTSLLRPERVQELNDTRRPRHRSDLTPKKRTGYEARFNNSN